MSDRYDLVVIGAGSGGLVGARFAAQLGAKVALVEKNRIGGDCTWTGCVPSKALLKVAKVAHEVRTADHYGVTATAPTVHMPAVRAYVRSAMESVYQFETPETLAQEGVDVVPGEARFLSESEIAVGNRTLGSKAFLITTGARPFVPAIPGLTDVPFITYESVFDNETLPKTMTVMGGGPIGMEMAQAYQRMGSQVTVIANSVLPKDEPEVQLLMQDVLQHEGVRFILEPAIAARKDGDAVVIDTKHHEVRGELLLVAVGRRPNVRGLELANAAVKHSERGIAVDKRLRTSTKYIYAAGDVTGSHQFTHYAGWQAFQAVRNALLPGHSVGVNDNVPWVTFTDPEVAHIGVAETEARKRYADHVQVHRWDLAKVDRAVCENDGAGFMKIITKPNGAILGATIVAARAGEAISEIALAIKQGMKVSDIAGAIHPYPTYSTVVQQLATEIAIDQFNSGAFGTIVKALSKILR